MLPTHSIRITVKLRVIRTTPPSMAPAPTSAYLPSSAHSWKQEEFKRHYYLLHVNSSLTNFIKYCIDLEGAFQINSKSNSILCMHNSNSMQLCKWWSVVMANILLMEWFWMLLPTVLYTIVLGVCNKWTASAVWENKYI